jgi:hypothetical protein
MFSPIGTALTNALNTHQNANHRGPEAKKKQQARPHRIWIGVWPQANGCSSNYE